MRGETIKGYKFITKDMESREGNLKWRLKRWNKLIEKYLERTKG